LARWQHIDVWVGECQKCGREMEFNIKMDGEDGRYYAYWNRHPCEADGDPLLLGELTWSSSTTLTSLRERVAELLVLAK
jgi:hypothetical protein